MSNAFIDPVVADIHAVRAEMLANAGGDIERLMQQVVKRQRKSKHQIITQPLRKRTEKIDEPERTRGS